MDKFITISKLDEEKINQILKTSFYYEDYSSSELVFDNMFVWNYQKQIEILWLHSELAIIRSLEKDNVWIFFPPVAKDQENFLRGLDYVRGNYPTNIVSGLTKTMVDAAQNSGGLFLYDDYFSEYIYDPRELAEMKGGTFSRKRNLIAQFKKKYAYEFASYREENFEDVIAFLNRYRAEGGACEDFEAITYALEKRRELNILCDLLLVDHLVVGISIGTISIFNHAVTLFEKNDFNYVGSGAILVQLTTAKHYANCRCLTRQEDLGLPQLRKAKLSLNPIVKERKYACVFDPITIALYHLYADTFDDSPDYVDFFFLHTYHRDRSFYVMRDNQVASALHIVMKTMAFNGRELPLPFVVAASTRLAYRRQGLMRKVMINAFQRLRELGREVVALYPVNPDFYLDYGFVHYTFTRNLKDYISTFECGLEQTNDGRLLSEMYNACIQHCDGYVQRDENYYGEYLNSLWQDKVVFDLIKKDGNPIGYVAHKDGDIDEILLCGDECPVHKLVDFANANLSHPEGTIPANMIRIINIERFLLNMKFKECVKAKISMRITDRFVAANNVDIELRVENGRADLSHASEPELTIDIEALTKVLFLGRGDFRLAFLFPNKKMVCFDKF